MTARLTRSGEPPDGASLVLVVDDTLANRYFMSRLLRGAGMRVIEAESGAEALRLVEQDPDLVVLDINLPDMDGHTVRRAIQQRPATAWMPVMHISASAIGSAEQARGLEEGADAYLTHPLEPRVFLATARALLRVGRAEARLRAASAEWSATFDAITDAIYLLDRDGRIRRSNAAGAALVAALGDDTAAPRFEARFGPVAGDVARGVSRDRSAVHGAELDVRGEWYALSASPVGSQDVEIVCALVSIGRRKSAEQDRERLLASAQQALADAETARREAEEANRAKSDFLAVMSHELRTPLNAIGGYVDLLSLGIRGPVTEAQETDLQRIRRSQLVLLGLINDLLSFAKLESGSLKYTFETVALDEALAGAAEFVEAQMASKGLRYRQLPCDPSVRADADRDKLQQVLLNLLSNAVKFTEPGGEVTLRCEDGDSTVRIRVQDTGRGIPTEKLDAIFDPFVQIDQRRIREHDGIGLGLSISRDLARGMGGELIAESRLGEGSTFTLTLRKAKD